MDSDEQPTITETEEAAWAVKQRERVLEYLVLQRVDHAGVSLEPRWFLSPYIAIWAIRSKAKPDRIGWWAISGDLPTDYITCNKERDDADVLLAFASQWKEAAERMAMGEHSADYTIGPPELAKNFAPLLMSRAGILRDFAEKMKAGDAK